MYLYIRHDTSQTLTQLALALIFIVHEESNPILLSILTV